MNTKIILLFCLLSFQVSAQNDPVPPKYEFRGAWIATVANIDWPSKTGLTIAQQKKEAIDMLDRLKKDGINAVIFQVRPAADAFYPSKREPWSRYLTGISGKDPGYDPLAFWITACHKRNMEFHAWLNPYRVAQNEKEKLAADHIAFKHPEWIIKYGGKLYFNPGIPEVRNFINEVVKDIVSGYDIDAIHFDDYFYPYPIPGSTFPDRTTYSRYPRGFTPDQIDDWRRDNVDLVIQMLSQTIKSVKPWVKFGISPFGVWRNKTDDTRGSLTRAGTTNYDQLYADILKWQRNGWIDYVLPQLYWQIGHPSVDFELLCHWWNNNRFNRALYIGQALYRLDANSKIPEWQQPDQLTRQIRLLRRIPGIEGSAFFSAKWFKVNTMGFEDSLRYSLYATPAIVPPMKWIDNKAPAAPIRLRKRGRKIKWKTVSAGNEMDRAYRFVVYRTEAGEPFLQNDPRSILVITRANKIRIEKGKGKKKRYQLRVSALDRMNNESEVTRVVNMKW